MPNTHPLASRWLPTLLGSLISLAVSGVVRADATLDKIQERHRLVVGVLLSGGPFGSIDPATQKATGLNVDMTEEGTTCVLVTHEMRFAEEVSDVVYFTENGRIVEHGSAEQIFQRPGNERTQAFLRHALGDSGRRPAQNTDPWLLGNLGRYNLSV